MAAAQNNSGPPKKRSKKYEGYNCVVGGCYSNHGSGQTLHGFPTDVHLRNEWVKFVQVCRVDFGPSYDTPTKNSKICHLHFVPESYPPKNDIAASFGMTFKRKLLPGSIPTIHKPSVSVANCTASSSVNVIGLDHDYYRVTSTSSTTTSTTTSMASSANVCTVSVCSTVSTPCVRTAYAKREHKRVRFLLPVSIIILSISM